MIEIIQKLDSQSKFSLLATAFALSVFMVLVLNLLDSVRYMLELIQDPDYEYISFSFEDGHYTINDQKMGYSIFYNFISVLFLWVIMVYYDLKSINKPAGGNSFFEINYFNQFK